MVHIVEEGLSFSTEAMKEFIKLRGKRLVALLPDSPEIFKNKGL